jgi:hypothetical protein
MSAIEKICEYSGEYGYGDMYRWKRNLIQVLPEHRHVFRNQDAVLYIQKEPTEYRISHRPHTWVSTCNAVDLPERIFKNGGKSYDTVTASNAWHPCRVFPEYNYVLYVPAVPGRVAGVYLNWTNDLTTVKRKLKRLLRCKKLKIEYVDFELHIKSVLNYIGEQK